MRRLLPVMIPPPAGFRRPTRQHPLKAKRPAVTGRPSANQQGVG